MVLIEYGKVEMLVPTLAAHGYSFFLVFLDLFAVKWSQLLNCIYIL